MDRTQLTKSAQRALFNLEHDIDNLSPDDVRAIINEIEWLADEYMRMCENLHAVVKKHGISSPGNVDEVVAAWIDEKLA